MFEKYQRVGHNAHVAINSIIPDESDKKVESEQPLKIETPNEKMR